MWSRRGLLQTALSCSGWLLLVPLVWLTQDPRFGGAYLSLPIWLSALLFAALVSTTTILVACMKRSWGVALVSLALAAAGMAFTLRQSSQVDYAEYQVSSHRTELAATADGDRGRPRRELGDGWWWVA
ncbi:hypothetical protein ADL15_38520 [Actinoplanes awajinensis subsp. mycoplanecinus]|uniref:Uncharacterized protein n=1 Tax=Actinoplanes awajinensis subsp. mycoplanecinus TaxID=135947 RepID=A0A101JGE2_9ACTN|nr:hypothetical protein ADL15_38520 [Actinoplanes awajinensis subsp. mycoplanecinus]